MIDREFVLQQTPFCFIIMLYLENNYDFRCMVMIKIKIDCYILN